MKEKLIKRCLILAVLMLSLVSISTAACPRATPELYQAQCRSDFTVPAPGILKNTLRTLEKLFKFSIRKIFPSILNWELWT